MSPIGVQQGSACNATLVRVAVYLPHNGDLVNLATELAAPAWLALRNPSSAKQMPPHSEHAYFRTSVPVKNYSLGRGPKVLMLMVSAIAW